MIASILLASTPIFLILASIIILPICIIRRGNNENKTGQSFCQVIWEIPSGIGSFFGACIGLMAVGYSLFLSTYISSESEKHNAIERSKNVAAILQGEISSIRIYANEITCLMTLNNTEDKIPYPKPVLWPIYAKDIATLSPNAILSLTHFYGLYENQLKGNHRKPRSGERSGDIKARIAFSLVEHAGLTITELSKISGVRTAPIRNCLKRK